MLQLKVGAEASVCGFERSAPAGEDQLFGQCGAPLELCADHDTDA